MPVEQISVSQMPVGQMIFDQTTWYYCLAERDEICQKKIATSFDPILWLFRLIDNAINAKNREKFKTFFSV